MWQKKHSKSTSTFVLGPKNRAVILVSCAFVAWALVLAWIKATEEPISQEALYQYTIHGHKVLLKTPPRNPRGLFFVAHGCSHSSTDWFTECDDCVGLPEEVAIVQLAMDRDLLVVAVSSLNRNTKCWSEQDGPVVALVLKTLQQNLRNTFIVAMGASSGGSFVSSILPTYVKNDTTDLYKGYIAQISPPPPRASTENDDMIRVFISMNRDTRIDAALQHYRKEHATSSRTLHHVRLDPLAITPDFFAQRISYTPPHHSQAMVAALYSASLLSKEGYLLQDPRRSHEWKKVLAPFAGEEDTLMADQSPIFEVLNVAWGMHEITRDGVGDALDFLLHHLEQ